MIAWLLGLFGLRQIPPKIKPCAHVFSIYEWEPLLKSACVLCGEEHPDSGKFTGPKRKV